jgi:hypothetical protein
MPNLWATEIIGLWTKNNLDRASGILPLPPLNFQVASCGGNAAEGKDLQYCNISYLSLNVQAEGRKTIGINNRNDTVIATSSGGGTVATPTSIQENQADTVHDLSPLMPVTANHFVLQGDLTNLSMLPDQCYDVFASCATLPADKINPPTAPIDTPIAPIDAPIAPIDAPITPIASPIAPIASPIAPIASPTDPVDPAPPDLLPPNPEISVDDPGPVSDLLPIFTPLPIASSVPEPPTGVMIMIGFGIMVLVCRGSALHAIKQGVVGIVFKIAKKSFHHYTA